MIAKTAAFTGPTSRAPPQATTAIISAPYPPLTALCNVAKQLFAAIASPIVNCMTAAKEASTNATCQLDILAENRFLLTYCETKRAKAAEREPIRPPALDP